MDPVYVTAVAVLSALGVAGTLHPAFNDNLPQRAGMGMIALGGAVEAFALMHHSFAGQNAHLLLVLGCAVYGTGSALKTWKYRGTCRHNKKR